MPSCLDCRFFDAKISTTTLVGQCRHGAPPALALTAEDGRRQIKVHAFWPLVDGTDWCGDFEARAVPNPAALVELTSTETGELDLVDLPPNTLRLCRFCNAQIIFGPTAETRMPLTWPHDPTGNVVFDPRKPDELVAVYRNGEAVPEDVPPEHRWHSHFMNCPGAKGARRRKS